MLTEKQIRAAKPRSALYYLNDGQNLRLRVDPSGTKLWRYRYRYGGRENTLGLGRYPEITLAMARERRDAARRTLANGVDPAAAKKAAKVALGNTFAALAEEWLAVHGKSVDTKTASTARARLQRYVLPHIGSRPIADIETPDVLGVLRRVESTGALETAQRVRAVVSRVLRYGMQTGRVKYDISAGLAGAIAQPDSKGFATITDPEQVGALLRAIDGYHGDPLTRAALRLAPLVFVRPGELRAAEWAEFDLGRAEWRIPGSRMKMGREHVVPLSRQAADIFAGLRPLTGSGRYVFPSLRSRDRPMSDGTLNAALRRLGYSSEQMTAHGFRSMASTLLNERGFPPDIIEVQLAHQDSSVRAIYNRSTRLPERRAMMQGWADYLDELQHGENGARK